MNSGTPSSSALAQTALNGEAEYSTPFTAPRIAAAGMAGALIADPILLAAREVACKGALADVAEMAVSMDVDRLHTLAGDRHRKLARTGLLGLRLVEQAAAAEHDTRLEEVPSRTHFNSPVFPGACALSIQGGLALRVAGDAA